MQLEDQMCSLELAKRLKELGVEQDSLFYYRTQYLYDGSDEIVLMINKFDSPRAHERMSNPKYSAFTVAELGEMLPARLKPDLPSKKFARLDICKGTDSRWLISYYYDITLPPKNALIGNTEADARAKMLIYLIENDLIKENQNAVKEREV